MRRTTLGNLLLDRALPEGMRGRELNLNKAGVAALFDELARDHPEKYRDVAKALTDVGRDVSQATGGFSFSLAHMGPSPAGERVKDRLRSDLAAIHHRPGLTPEAREQAVTDLLARYQKPLESAVFDESKAEGNPLAHQVENVGRGNKAGLKALRAGDLLYVDHHERPIPIPVLNSYAKGLDPAEYFAASFGARKGVVDTKLCLHEDTQVRMADGSIKAIRDVRVGDLVVAVDAFGSCVGPARVLAVHDNGVRDCWLYSFDDLDRVTRSRRACASLSATADHKVLRDCNDREDWQNEARGSAFAAIPMGAWAINDAPIWLDPASGAGPLGSWSWERTYWQSNDEVFLAAVSAEPSPRRTFDLEIDHRDHLFLLANGLVVANSTAQSGFLGKQLSQMTHRLVVTADDHDDNVDRSDRGLPVDTDDPDNIGALLARPAGLHGRDTVLTAARLAELKSHGVDQILVRSPIVGGPAMGGVLARDVGVRERGVMAPKGDYVGLAASQAISEKLSQGMLCLWEETLVRMADGSTRMIKDIGAGDRVVGWDRERRRPVEVVVLANHDNGERDCWRVVWDDGRRRLVATGDHKVAGPCRYGDDFDLWGLSPLRDVLAGDAGLMCLPAWTTSPVNIAAIAMGGSVTRPTVGDYQDDVTAFFGDGISAVALGPLPTRDLEVDHPDHLFVLECGLVVSNSSKHAGGVAGQSAAPSGFPLVESLVQIPRVFPGGAAHAQHSGKITGIAEAPQGGTHIDVEGKRHYAAHGQHPTVNVGDMVEAGDVLSDGIPNPAELVRHKGIGEGRRHFVAAFQAALAGSGMKAHRRNLELLARGAIDHVELDHEIGPHSPGDILPYQSLEAEYEPREDAREKAPEEALGRFLERPVLHHTIGTQVRPAMVADLERFGISRILTHHAPPPFRPVMLRAKSALEHDPDWLTRHLGSNLQRSTLEAAHRGRASDTAGTSYVPALAERAHFGRSGPTKGWVSPHPRDGDGDGLVGDGSPGEKAAWYADVTEDEDDE